MMAQSDTIWKNKPDKPTLRPDREQLKLVHQRGSLMQPCRKRIHMKAPQRRGLQIYILGCQVTGKFALPCGRHHQSKLIYIISASAA